MSAINNYLSRIHSPKNVDYKSPVLVMFDDSSGQKYFDITFMVDAADGYLVSDIEMLNDSHTPDVIKQYINQHSTRPQFAVDSVPKSLQKDIDPFDYIIPRNKQTADEVVSYFNSVGVDVELNKLT